MGGAPGTGSRRARVWWTWFRQVVGGSYTTWRDARVIRLGAGLAYYALLAVVPLLSVGVSVAGLVVSEDEIQRYLAERLADIFDADAPTVASRLASALDTTTTAGLGLLGLGSLVLTGSLVFVALQDALNTIWQVPVRPGIRHTLLRRSLAFALVIGVGAYFVASLAIHTLTSLLEGVIPGDLSGLGPVNDVLDGTASWVLGISVIALLFRLLPGVRVPLSAIVLGAALTGVFLVLGTVAIGYYLREVASASLVGAFSGVLLLLVWIYYEAQILLVGAVVTKQLGEEWLPGRTALRRRSGSAGE